MKKTLAILLLVVILTLGLVACGKDEEKNGGEFTNSTSQTDKTDVEGKDETMNNEQLVSANNPYKDVEKNPVVTLEIKDLGIIKMELYPQVAPETVENFISLVNSGFYDGLIFHRVIPNFMIQGGDPDGNGTGGAEYNIVGEFGANGITNNLSHTRGIVSMARSQDPNSASSQFFIVTTDSTYLDNQYAAFGKVLEGMDVADKIVNVDVIRRQVEVDYYDNPEEYIKQSLECDRPVNPPVIEKATVDTFGVEYSEPTKLQ
ncbi:MAG: peptidylprolyl isomerase [Clostridia bacterium]|nr:peptidylprolyl isomerase [Clostridia bacterium]